MSRSWQRCEVVTICYTIILHTMYLKRRVVYLNMIDIIMSTSEKVARNKRDMIVDTLIDYVLASPPRLKVNKLLPSSSMIKHNRLPNV
jgi:hypothetical protein